MLRSAVPPAPCRGPVWRCTRRSAGTPGAICVRMPASAPQSLRGQSCHAAPGMVHVHTGFWHRAHSGVPESIGGACATRRDGLHSCSPRAGIGCDAALGRRGGVLGGSGGATGTLRPPGASLPAAEAPGACASCCAGAACACGAAALLRRCVTAGAEVEAVTARCCAVSAAARVFICGCSGTAVPKPPVPWPRCLRWHMLQNGSPSCSSSVTLSRRLLHTMHLRHVRWYAFPAGPMTCSAAYTRSSQRGQRGACTPKRGGMARRSALATTGTTAPRMEHAKSRDTRPPRRPRSGAASRRMHGHRADVAPARHLRAGALRAQEAGMYASSTSCDGSEVRTPGAVARECGVLTGPRRTMSHPSKSKVT